MSEMSNSSPKMRRISIKPLVPSQELNNTRDTTVAVGIGGSPTQKTKPGSIHELLRQMSVSSNSPDAKAGQLATQRWRSNARKIYDEFCTETSFTAVTRIYKATSICKKIAWLVISLLFVAWMTIQIVWLFQKYFSYPVQVKVSVNAVSKLDFPSITICNLNPLRKDMKHHGPFEDIRDIMELDDTDMLYDDYLDDLQEEWTRENKTYDINDQAFLTSFMQNRSYNKWEALENDTEIAEEYYRETDDEHAAGTAYSSLAASMDEDELKQYGHQKENLIMSCSWQGVGCSPSNFTYIRNNIYGNCYTFNAFDNGHANLYTNYAGPVHGLSLELNIEQDQYVPSLASDAGVRVVIHHRGVYPFPEDEGLSVAPGFKTSFGIKKTELIRLEPPHGDCGKGGNGVTNMYTENFGTSYSKQTCFKSCFQSAIISECGCANSFFYVSKNTSVCSNYSSCKDAYLTSAMETCNAKCPSPCDEMKYDVTMSMSKWPSEQYADHLDTKITKANSLFMDESERADRVSNRLDPDEAPSYSAPHLDPNCLQSDDTLTKVVIYFEDLIYEKVEQQKAYESQNLISDIGGQLGLWLGLSAITVGEVIEFIAAICQLAMAKCSGKGGKKTPAKGSETVKVAPLND